MLLMLLLLNACSVFISDGKLGWEPRCMKTEHIKFFEKPFCTDNYLQHHRQQHPECWEAYQAASKDNKMSFFESIHPIWLTLLHHFSGKQVTRQYFINRLIINAIIGDLLWDPEEVDGNMRANTMNCFKEYADESRQLQRGKEADHF